MNPSRKISRRDFLKLAGVVAGGTVLGGCQPAPAFLPIPPKATISVPPARVGISCANSYEPGLVRRQVESLFDSLGGLGDVVKPGDSVAIKVNLTGGVNADPPPAGTTATESYLTHPSVVRAVGELLRDAGARDISIVEAVWQWESFLKWGYLDLAVSLGAVLIDLNDTKPYSSFTSVPVGKDWFIYKKFTLNRRLEEVDVLISVAKMKCHWLCGITQSMKNLIGLVPYKFYEYSPGDGYRTGFHGAETEIKQRLPRVILDLNRARPIDLALIDGIQTVDGCEGPWIQDLHLQKPGILIGGKNPVATDAVAAAAMGFDPEAEYPNPPFLRAENHLNLARQLGLGPNRLADIEVVGAKLEDVKMQFLPALGSRAPGLDCFGRMAQRQEAA